MSRVGGSGDRSRDVSRNRDTQQSTRSTRNNNSTPASTTNQTGAASRTAPQRSSFEVNVNRSQGLFSDRSTVTVNRNQGDLQTSRSATHVNGRLSSTSSSSTSTQDSLTSSTQVDTRYGRDGQQTGQRVSQSVTQQYGDHTSIGRTNVQDGRFSSESIQYNNQNGNTSRSTTMTNSSGPQTTARSTSMAYQGGEYKNTGPYGNSSYQNGSFQSTHSVDHTNQRATSTQTTITRDSLAGQRGTEADNTRLEARNEQIGQRQARQRNLDVLGDMGLQTTIAGGGDPQTTRVGAQTQTNTVTNGDTTTTTESLVGPSASTTQYGEVTVGANGIGARGNVDARAGVYAQSSVTQTSDAGTVTGSAGAKVEAHAQANGQASLNLNGLEARGHASVGVEASAEVSGSYTTPPVSIGGQEFTAGVSAQGRVAAEAKAEASGRVQFTGNPPSAIVEGQAGASAVVKAEGEARIDAGPFSVRAQGYVSAGAEAQANGSIGYDDGKLTLSFGAGAALGVGAGGRAQVTVDVAQIGRAAEGAFQETVGQHIDVDGDGRFGMSDARAVGTEVVNDVRDFGNSVAREAGELRDAAVDTARDVRDAAVDTARDIGEGISNRVDSAREGIADAGRAVADFFGW